VGGNRARTVRESDEFRLPSEPRERRSVEEALGLGSRRAAIFGNPPGRGDPDSPRRSQLLRLQRLVVHSDAVPCRLPTVVAGRSRRQALVARGRTAGAGPLRRTGARSGSFRQPPAAAGAARLHPLIRVARAARARTPVGTGRRSAGASFLSSAPPLSRSRSSVSTTSPQFHDLTLLQLTITPFVTRTTVWGAKISVPADARPPCICRSLLEKRHSKSSRY